MMRTIFEYFCRQNVTNRNSLPQTPHQRRRIYFVTTVGRNCMAISEKWKVFST